MLKKYLGRPLFWASIIFIVAATFRVFYLNLIEFKYDEAASLFQITQFYFHPYLIQIGLMASTGMYNFPLFSYILVILGILSQNPQFISFLIGLINALIIVFFYLVIRKYLGNRLAIFSSLTLAVTPWAILFSRKIWAQDLILLFLVPALFFFFQLVFNKRIKAVMPLSFLLALLIQLHGSGLYLLLTFALTAIILKIKIDIKKALAGFCLGFVPAVPYFWYQLTSSPFCRDCYALINYQRQVRPFDLTTFIRPLEIIGSSSFPLVLGQSYNQFIQNYPFVELLNIFNYLEYTIIFLSIVLILKFKQNLNFLIIIFTLVPLIYFLTRIPSYTHYFIILLPVSVLLYSLFFEILYSLSKTKFIKGLMISAFLIFFIAKITFNILFYQFIAQAKVIEGDYGPIFTVTDNLIKDQINRYQLLPEYGLLKSYSYVFAQTKFLHQKLGEYFVQTGQPGFAIDEFKKALIDHDQDKYSRANLAYLYIQTANMTSARQELGILEIQDATLAAKLKAILENNKGR